MQAVKLDDTLPEAHVSLALVRESYDWDWRGAESEFKRAIQLNPNNASGHQWYGDFLTRMGRFDEAQDRTQKGPGTRSAVAAHAYAAWAASLLTRQYTTRRSATHKNVGYGSKIRPGSACHRGIRLRAKRQCSKKLSANGRK